MAEMLAAALGYAARGWHVFPLNSIRDGACTCGREGCSNAGKHPLTRHGLRDASAERAAVIAWWTKWPWANIGIATGEASGIVVVDVDLPKAHGSIATLLDGGCAFPTTMVGLTGGGGLHLVFERGDVELRNHTSRLPGVEGELPGMDLRADGGYVVAPPSIHRSGGRYAWLYPDSVIASLPLWLREPPRVEYQVAAVVPIHLDGDGTRYGLAALEAEISKLESTSVGGRNHALNRAAFSLARLVGGGELTETVVRQRLAASAARMGLDEWESGQTIESGFRAGVARPRQAPSRLKESAPVA